MAPARAGCHVAGNGARTCDPLAWCLQRPPQERRARPVSAWGLADAQLSAIAQHACAGAPVAQCLWCAFRHGRVKAAVLMSRGEPGIYDCTVCKALYERASHSSTLQCNCQPPIRDHGLCNWVQCYVPSASRFSNTPCTRYALQHRWRGHACQYYKASDEGVILHSLPMPVLTSSCMLQSATHLHVTHTT